MQARVIPEVMVLAVPVHDEQKWSMTGSGDSIGSCGNIYSVLNDLTGLATAALKAWRLTVRMAMRMARRPERTNIQALRGAL